MPLKIKLNPDPTYPMPPTMWAGDGMTEGAEAGANSGILHGIAPGAHMVGDSRTYLNVSLNKLKNYLAYVATPPQPQSGNGADSMGCTTHGWNRCFEAIFTYMYHSGMLAEEFCTFLENENYFDQNGRLAFDDRILVVESGTTENGNYMDTVGEKSRTGLGFCPARPYDWTKYTRKDYFTLDPAVREKQLALGKKFLTFVTIYHRWLLTGSSGAGAAAVIEQYLEYGPLYAASATHCFAIIAIEGEIITYYDSYSPWIRQRPLSSLPQLWLKQVVAVPNVTKQAIPFLPYYEKKIGQSTIAVYDPATDKMVPIADGNTYHIINAEYKRAKSVPNWIRELDTTRVVTVTNPSTNL